RVGPSLFNKRNGFQRLCLWRGSSSRAARRADPLAGPGAAPRPDRPKDLSPHFRLIVEEAAEFAAAAGVFEFAQGLGFDLADAFAGDVELLADFFERVVGVHADAEAHAEHAFLARGERGEDAGGGFA